MGRYLSNATHGITIAQYQRIARLPGVGVAAPLAILGYVLQQSIILITLTPAATGQSGGRVLVVRSSYTADQGLSKYPAIDDNYDYITPLSSPASPSACPARS
jgi:putative ABC transport system permease protein